MDNNLVTPGGLLLPPSMQFKQVSGIGPFATGHRLPIHGLVMEVVKVEANDNLDFRIILEPRAVSSGARKRMEGKKGKANRKAAKRGRIPASSSLAI